MTRRVRTPWSGAGVGVEDFGVRLLTRRYSDQVLRASIFWTRLSRSCGVSPIARAQGDGNPESSFLYERAPVLVHTDRPDIAPSANVNETGTDRGTARRDARVFGDVA
jgi:hypothetical protein